MDFLACLSAFLAYSEPKASWVVYKRLAAQHFRQWDDWPTCLQIEEWHRACAATPHHANKGLTLLKTLYTWAIRRGYYAGPSPAAGIKRHTTHSRDRVMSHEEIALFLNCRAMIPLKMAVMGEVLLTTGARLSEARSMEKRYVDLATGRWYIPHTKNGRPLTTYLPQQVRRSIAQLQSKGDYIFAGAYEHCWSRPGVEKVWAQVRGALGLFDVRLHDFRRTLATHLYRATKDDYLVKRCINHVNPSMTAVYVRISYEDVVEALQQQADRFYGATG